MIACGLIVEYNPFHNGHVYHIERARIASGADCMIAVMSGSFLQRGEPALMDKFHRTKAAIETGIDLVLELPYIYAVQNSDLFAEGAIKTLNEAGVTSICFGSESGQISDFIDGYQTYKDSNQMYKDTLKEHLDKGLSFPMASKQAYKAIGLTEENTDLSKPNNILGFSYVKTIIENNLSITPLTIKRTNNDFHDETITSNIASATSIRKELLKHQTITPKIRAAIPAATATQLIQYKDAASDWHDWEKYFHLLQYRVMTMNVNELSAIQGINEGLEYRIKKTAQTATSFKDWMEKIKTKRYTWTRIQRIFVHLLTNSKKTDFPSDYQQTIPYVRVLGMNKTGQAFLNYQKKRMEVPLISRFMRNQDPSLMIEEKATYAYYSIFSPQKSRQLFKQELQAPIMVTK